MACGEVTQKSCCPKNICGDEPKTLKQYVSEYIKFSQKDNSTLLKKYASLHSFDEALYHAGNALIPPCPDKSDEKPKKHPHQYRILLTALASSYKNLKQHSNDIKKCKSFHEIYNIVFQVSQILVDGIGPVTTYDTSLAIASFLKIMPEYVYLHAGTREGAKALNIDVRGKQYLLMQELPKSIHRLSPGEAEDFLCIYKNCFKKLMGKCYLCGEYITEVKSDDHVPPKQFYASIFRKSLKLNLLTLPAHMKCNKSYEKDEVYFLNSLAPISMDTKAGLEIWRDIVKSGKRKESRLLIQKILNEFTHKPYGLYLPNYLVAKKIEYDRVQRVIWKIVRGLYYYEFNQQLLPIDNEHVIELYDKHNKPREEFKFVRDTESKGRYPGVFDYKFIETDEYIMWGMLFWDYFISLVIHKKN